MQAFALQYWPPSGKMAHWLFSKVGPTFWSITGADLPVWIFETEEDGSEGPCEAFDRPKTGSALQTLRNIPQLWCRLYRMNNPNKAYRGPLQLCAGWGSDCMSTEYPSRPFRQIRGHVSNTPPRRTHNPSQGMMLVIKPISLLLERCSGFYR